MKLYHNYKNTIGCLSCRKNSHLINSCPKIHYVAIKDFILKRYIHTSEQSRQKVSRRLCDRKKYNTFKNFNSVQATIEEFQELTMTLNLLI